MCCLVSEDSSPLAPILSSPCAFGSWCLTEMTGIWNNYDPAMKFMCTPWDDVVRSPDEASLCLYDR
ncbi:hypothetical protein GGI43DRAFT_398094 [Trichoderma evansii]